MNLEKTIKVVISVVILILLGFLAVWTIRIIQVSRNSDIRIRLLNPDNESVSITSGDLVFMTIEAYAKHGLDQAVVLVNDQVVTVSSYGIEAPVSKILSFPWISSEIGIHKVSMLIKDTRGFSSETVNVIAAVLPQTTGSGSSLELIDLPDAPPTSTEEPAPSPGSADAGLPNTGGDPPDGFAPFPGDEGPPPGDEPHFELPAGIDVEGLHILDEQMQQISPDADFPLLLPDQPGVDDPPQVFLEYHILRSEGNTIISLNSTSSDDTQVEFVKMWHGPTGGEITFKQENCLEPTCMIGIGITVNSGKYKFAAQAIDSSGQASQLEVIEIVLAEGDLSGLPPAIMIGNPISVQESGCLPGEEIGSFSMDPGASIQQLLEGYIHMADCAPQVADPMGGGAGGSGSGFNLDEVDWNACVEFFVIPESPTTNDLYILRVVVTCDLYAPAGEEFFLEIAYDQLMLNTPVNPGELPEMVPLADWNAPTLIEIPAYTNFETTFTPEQYDLHYDQRFFLGISTEPLGAADDGIFIPNRYEDSKRIFTRSSYWTNRELPEMGMTITDLAGGYKLDWWIYSSLYENLGLEPGHDYAVRFVLWDHIHNTRTELGDLNTNFTMLPFSGSGFVPYTEKCVQLPYIQMVIVDPSNSDVIAYISQVPPDSWCIPDSFGSHNWEFQVEDYYRKKADGTSNLMTNINVIKRNVGWFFPIDQDLIIITIEPANAYAYIHVTNAMREKGNLDEEVDFEDVFICGAVSPYIIQPYLTHFTGGSGIPDMHGPVFHRGPEIESWAEPCLPLPPENLSAHAVTDVGQNKIILDWSPGTIRDVRRFHQPTTLILTREVLTGNRDDKVIELVPEQTKYVDTDIGPGINYRYSLRYEWSSHYAEEVVIDIQTPMEITGWDCLVEPGDLGACQ